MPAGRTYTDSDAAHHALPPLDQLRRLPRQFYGQPVLEVARASVGKLLVHHRRGRTLVGRIVETEAYRGPEDLAAHSAGGRRTPRNEAMWGPPGHAYVFFVYGMHWHLNLVAGLDGEPHAVLIRGVEPLLGVELMARRRKMTADRRELTNGPGKLCVAFGIDRRHDGVDLTGSGGLYLADAPATRVVTARRVGIDYAGAWAKRRWRFLEPGNRYVSRPPEGRLRGA
ncbi:MAG: DNA-3-methyladenine glycosylase [Polyangiaceae bacterium]|nr:DNA-3-methyladenine glycosylase [Polyangiaceae bacterium]